MISQKEIEIFINSSNTLKGELWVVYMNGKVFSTYGNKSIFKSKKAAITALKQSAIISAKKGYLYNYPECLNLPKDASTEEINSIAKKKSEEVLEYMIENNIITFRKL